MAGLAAHPHLQRSSAASVNSISTGRASPGHENPEEPLIRQRSATGVTQHEEVPHLQGSNRQGTVGGWKTALFSLFGSHELATPEVQ